MFYKLCVAPAGLPANLDAHFTYVSSAELIVASSSPTPPPSPPPPMEALTQQIAALAANVAAQSSALSTQSSTLSTLSGNVAALSAALSCGAGGRRLETQTDASSVPSVPSESATAQTIVDDFLSRRPDLAGTRQRGSRSSGSILGCRRSRKANERRHAAIAYPFRNDIRTSSIGSALVPPSSSRKRVPARRSCKPVLLRTVTVPASSNVATAALAAATFALSPAAFRLDAAVAAAVAAATFALASATFSLARRRSERAGGPRRPRTYRRQREGRRTLRHQSEQCQQRRLPWGCWR